MAEMIPLTSIDKIFFRFETPHTPIHTASLCTYRLPPDAAPDYPQRLFRKLFAQHIAAAPFNYVLRTRGRAMFWEVLQPEQIDPDYHIRHSALPYPGGETELGKLISRLHSIHLDRSRPLWEFHLIENLHGNRFATYMKMHHALADGGAVIKILNDTFARSPSNDCRAPWARAMSAPRHEPAIAREAQAKQSKAQLLKVVRDMVKSLLSRPQEGLVGPWAAPPSPLNVPVTAPRRYATLQVSFKRMKAVSKVAGATVNDVLLAMVSAALRRYLDELGALPSRSLTASVPMALDREGEDLGNAVAALFTTLATTSADPKERLRIISDSVSKNKKAVLQLTTAQQRMLTLVAALPFMFAKPRTPRRPVYNVVVSNVPGPRERLWLEGSEVEALYPCSMVMQQYALNITARGYHDTINIGFVGARDALPHFQRVAVYTADALTELEQSFDLATAEAGEDSAMKVGPS